MLSCLTEPRRPRCCCRLPKIQLPLEKRKTRQRLRPWHRFSLAVFAVVHLGFSSTEVLSKTHGDCLPPSPSEGTLSSGERPQPAGQHHTFSCAAKCKAHLWVQSSSKLLKQFPANCRCPSLCVYKTGKNTFILFLNCFQTWIGFDV